MNSIGRLRALILNVVLAVILLVAGGSAASAATYYSQGSVNPGVRFVTLVARPAKSCSEGAGI